MFCSEINAPIEKSTAMKIFALDLDLVFSTKSAKWVIGYTWPIPHYPFLYGGSKTFLYLEVLKDIEDSSKLFVNMLSAIIFVFLVLLRQIILLLMLNKKT